jgi:hypothetical protein
MADRAYLEIVVWVPFMPDAPEADRIQFQRRLATVRVNANGVVVALDRNRRTITGVGAHQPGESVWRLIERVAARLANSDEIGG